MDLVGEKKTRKIRRKIKKPIVEKKPERLNEKLADLMNRLSILMNKKGENFKSRAYTKAEETILSFTEDITDIKQLEGKPGIGSTIMEKFKEYMETGTLELLEKEKENPENILADVYGIGPKKAQELVKQGIDSIAKLREKQDEVLNDTQKIGLKYYEDILERIPRSEIEKYNKIFQKVMKKVADEDSNYEIVGSYRRGASNSGDIDVIITSKSLEVFKKFIDLLIENKIILHVLSRGNSKCLVVCKLGKNHARRVDFLYTTKEEYPFSVLYFTGSKAFNTVMRGHALRKGYTMNEHGIKKLRGSPVIEKFGKEKDIFDFLNLEYKEPSERIDGRSVVMKRIEILEEKKEIGEPVVEKPKKTRKIREPKATKEPKVPKEKKPKTEKKQKEPKVPKEKKPKTEKKQKEPKIPKEKKTKTLKKREPIEKPKKEQENNIKLSPEMKEEKPMKKNTPTKEIIMNFKANGISVLEKLTESQLSDIIKEANAAYYNETPLMSDNEFDIVKEYIEKKYPKNTAIQQVGAPIEKNKVKLPYIMASMDKIKPDSNALPNWMKTYTGPYVLSCKLDGVSGMYSTENNTQKLYTRGDGKVGQDISHLIKVLNLPKHVNTVVRGEFIIPKKVFEEKYKEKFANPRNLVSGIINSKTVDEKAKDLHFVAYELIQPVMTPSSQMKKLQELQHEVVLHKVENELSNEMLSETLMDWRKNHEYEIDGVIVCNDKIYPRSTGNPEYAFAFKMVISDQVAEAKVVDVIWTASKSGYLKPRIQIEPIRLGGVTIEFATGFNGKFIEENKIGIGAVIQIIRSGDVIPYIKSVTTPSEKPKMPTVPYTWTDTHVDIVLENVAEDPVVLEKNITAFFVGLEVDGLSSGNVKRLINAGYNSISKILGMDKTDFEKVEGFKAKLTEKIYNGIREKVESASLIQIMAASNMFGRGIGSRKIEPIMEAYPDILTSKESDEEKIKMLKSINGIGNENANSFVNNISNFLAFLEECNLMSKLQKKEHVGEILSNTLRENIKSIDQSNPLYGKKIVMTKIRDKEIIEKLPMLGAILEDNIKKDTFVLIVKSKDDVSNKTKFAEANHIPVMEPNEFKQKYF
jgi:DNA ligase (NAD+)